MEGIPKFLVNPIAVKNCVVVIGGIESAVLDISYLRVVLEDTSTLPDFSEGEQVSLNFRLDGQCFSGGACFVCRREGWIRFAFGRIVPSAKAHLRSFLSPKKVGESLIEDRITSQVKHFHGLNESELWCEFGGAVLFTYLDAVDSGSQFVIRMAHSKSALIAGKILRKDYIELSSIDGELPFVALDDREIYNKLGECRDIVTNFRPTAHLEYNLKQRLLRVISDYLYSASRKVELTRMSSVRTLPLFTPET